MLIIIPDLIDPALKLTIYVSFVSHEAHYFKTVGKLIRIKHTVILTTNPVSMCNNAFNFTPYMHSTISIEHSLLKLDNSYIILMPNAYDDMA